MSFRVKYSFIDEQGVDNQFSNEHTNILKALGDYIVKVLSGFYYDVNISSK